MTNPRMVTESELAGAVDVNLRYIATCVERSRHTARISRYELARRAGTSEHTVAKIEEGRNVKFSTLVRVFEVLGMTMNITN